MKRNFEKLFFYGFVIFYNIKTIYCNKIIEKYEEKRMKKLDKESKGCCVSCKQIKVVEMNDKNKINLRSVEEFDENLLKYYSEDFSKKECVVYCINGVNFYFYNCNNEVIAVSIYGISKKVGLIDIKNLSEADKSKYSSNFKEFLEKVLLDKHISFNLCSSENPYILKVNFKQFLTFRQPVIGRRIKLSDSSKDCYFIPFNLKDQLEKGCVQLEHRFFYDVINDFFIDLCDSILVKYDEETGDGAQISKITLKDKKEVNVNFLYIIRSKNKNNLLDDFLNVNISFNNKDTVDYYYILKDYIVKIVPNKDSNTIGKAYYGDDSMFIGYLNKVDSNEFENILENVDFRNVALSILYFNNLAPEYINYKI